MFGFALFQQGLTGLHHLFLFYHLLTYLLVLVTTSGYVVGVFTIDRGDETSWSTILKCLNMHIINENIKGVISTFNVEVWVSFGRGAVFTMSTSRGPTAATMCPDMESSVGSTVVN